MAVGQPQVPAGCGVGPCLVGFSIWRFIAEWLSSPREDRDFCNLILKYNHITLAISYSLEVLLDSAHTPGGGGCGLQKAVNNRMWR